MIIKQFGNTVFIIGDGWSKTVFADGQEVEAVAHDTNSYRETALHLGYGNDVARMSADHELVHSWLCHALGMQYSPALRSVVGDAADYRHGLEEDAVLAVQRFAIAYGISLRSVLG